MSYRMDVQYAELIERERWRACPRDEPNAGKDS